MAKPRRTPGAWLKFEDRTEWVLDIFQPEARKVLESFETREAKMDWCNQDSKYFAPGPDRLLGSTRISKRLDAHSTHLISLNMSLAT